MSKKLGAFAVMVMLLWPAAGWAQIVGDDVPVGLQASWNTVEGGTVSLRAPGRVVNSALADYLERRNETLGQARSGPDITEPEPGLTPGQDVKIDVIEAVFGELNAMLTLLNEAIRASAGLAPLPPTDGAGTLADLLGNISGPGS